MQIQIYVPDKLVAMLNSIFNYHKCKPSRYIKLYLQTSTNFYRNETCEGTNDVSCFTDKNVSCQNLLFAATRGAVVSYSLSSIVYDNYKLHTDASPSGFILIL